jgi:hypothetical protein
LHGPHRAAVALGAVYRNLVEHRKKPACRLQTLSRGVRIYLELASKISQVDMGTYSTCELDCVDTWLESGSFGFEEETIGRAALPT